LIDLDYESGYFRARRSVWRALRGDPATVMVWLELEDRARYSERGPVIGTSGRVVDLELGEAVLGRRELAEALGLGAQQVRTAIKKLSRLGILATRESTHLGTVVKLVGFNGNAMRGPAGQPTNQPGGQPTANPQPTTNKTERHSGDLDLRSAEDPDQGSHRPPGDPGSARLGPRPASGADPDAVAEYERIRKLGGWGAPAPGLRIVTGGGS
jgi:hypothetical protein